MMMHSVTMMFLGLCILAGVASGCQHAADPSLAMQKKFLSAVKVSSGEEEKALRSAHYYRLAGRYDLALTELSRAVAQEPGNPRLLNALGSCYDRLGNHAKAQEIYNQVLAQDAANLAALNNIGYSCYLAGDLVQAEQKFQAVLAQDPVNDYARNNLGLVWCKQGKEQEALRLWQKNEGEMAAREKLEMVLAQLGIPMVKGLLASGPPQAGTSDMAAAPAGREKQPGPGGLGKIARTEKPLAKGKSTSPEPQDTGHIQVVRASRGKVPDPASPDAAISHPQAAAIQTVAYNQPLTTPTPVYSQDNRELAQDLTGAGRHLTPETKPQPRQTDAVDEAKRGPGEGGEKVQLTGHGRRTRMAAPAAAVTAKPQKSIREYFTNGYLVQDQGLFTRQETVIF
ncbi:MAG: tetratricopeptide repeat protein [Deltaproteobacteria bacterium]|nr:tetratricopeptide repeat protein [Deltaproteobacteria bacterium]